MLSVIVNGTEYSLDDGTYGLLRGHDGWGMPPSNRISSQGPLQHGVTDEGQFLQARFGTLFFLVPNTSLDTMYTSARENLLELFHPDNSPTLKWDLAKGERRIDCFYAEDMTMPWQPGSWANLNVSLVLKCPDPSFYNPTINVTQWLGASTGTSFEIPWLVPTFVGGSGIDQQKTINYAGTWYEYPEIEITGPGTDFVITNDANGYKLDFTGVTLATGEKRIIDTRYGFKTVENASGDNKIQDLTDDSDLATFRLERKRVTDVTRTNNITLTASGTDSNTSAIIRWKNRYIGV